MTVWALVRRVAGASLLCSGIAHGQGTVASWGDSMTAPREDHSDYPSVLSSLLARPVVNLGVPLQTASRVLAHMIADSTHRDEITVLWAGRNDNLAHRAHVALQEVTRAIGLLHEPRRFVVLGVTNGEWTDEYRGHWKWKAIERYNRELQALYPNNFIDIRQVLIARGCAQLPAGNADCLHDVVPASLRTDDIHLNAAGNRLVADEVARFLHAKGW